MCGFGEDVIARKRLIRICESLRYQKLFDGEEGKLDNLGPGNIDDGDKTRTCGFARIYRPPIWVKCGGSCLVEANCKDLGKFFDAKRPNRDREASEQTLRIFSFLLVYAQ